jgi:hypothetical protein
MPPSKKINIMDLPVDCRLLIVMALKPPPPMVSFSWMEQRQCLLPELWG